MGEEFRLLPRRGKSIHIGTSRSDPYRWQLVFIDEQVKNTLYRVWNTSFCRHSKHFERTLAVDQYSWSRDVADGTNEDHPLRLELVQPYDFDCLLSVIYPP
jgi:hypothetical protein